MEAEFLWSAECSITANNNISDNWGCVAILQNPKVQIPNYLMKDWKSRILKESKYPELSHSKSETSIVNDSGILQIPWPNMVNGKPLCFDLLLAIATNPELKGNPPTYPRIRDIVLAWKKQGNDEYFWKNQEHDIHTYQDKLIIQHMPSRESE